MASQTLKSFVKELPDFDDDIIKALVGEWNNETGFVQSDASRNAPVAGAFLIRSGVVQRARITASGIESQYSFTVPYAEKLNDITSGLNLKEKGEVSYYVKGQKVKKQKKGELGYSDLAVEKAAQNDRFINITNRAISRAWRNL
jgi:hypothetical protein